MTMLDERLLAAHAAGDHHALVPLYLAAADQAGTRDGKYFFLTQAYIFALEVDHVMQDELHRRLVIEGREV